MRLLGLSLPARFTTTIEALTTDKVAAFVIGSVPAVSAQTLAICRIVLGAGLLYFLMQYVPSDFARLFALDDRRLKAFTAVLNVGGVLSVMSASAAFCVTLYSTLIITAVMFTLGIATRLAAPLLTATLWLAALLMNQGHGITPLLLGITATMFAPWGAALSIDALLSPRKSAEASPYYGYAIWLLGLCIGLAYATAGLSKLTLTGGAWLWNTGARNGFIQDLWIAFSDAGIWISNNYVLALVASAVASFGQIAYVYVSFTRREDIKYAICFLIALPFLASLVLLMGHFWWPWALLVLILYLPWRWIDRRIAGVALPRRAEFPDTPRGQFHRSLFLSTTAGLVGLHIFALAIGKEFEPLFSNYPMYVSSMRAGSAHEAQFWEGYTKSGRHFRPVVDLVLADGKTSDVSLAYRVAEFLANWRIYKSPYEDLLGRPLLRGYWSIDADGTVPSNVCQVIRTAAARVSDGAAVAVRYNRHFYDLREGVLLWLPLDDAAAVTLDLASCQLTSRW
jgi:Vitamin K-dependent gamma-carboxylase